MPLASLTTEAQLSALDPAGPHAAAIAGLWWFMLTVCGIVFGLVMLSVVFALVRKHQGSRVGPPGGDTAFILIGGAILPFGVLVAFLAYTLVVTAEVEAAADGLTIEVTGHKWWWEVRYPESGVVTANELYVPVGEPVRIVLRAEDVIHTFWVPNLGGKTDMLPGLTNVHVLAADRPGVYKGVCAEFCGLQHARMAFYVVAVPPEEFRAWIDARREPPPPPDDPELRLGHDTFHEAGCGECHAIRGTRAVGAVAPDLTHMGSRLSIGAGTLPMNRGNLQGWIANPQALKPGNLMPPAYLEPDRLQALTVYLMSLR